MPAYFMVMMRKRHRRWVRWVYEPEPDYSWDWSHDVEPPKLNSMGVIEPVECTPAAHNNGRNEWEFRYSPRRDVYRRVWRAPWHGEYELPPRRIQPTTKTRHLSAEPPAHWPIAAALIAAVVVAITSRP